MMFIYRYHGTKYVVIEHSGGVAPDEVLRRSRRAERGKRPFQPHPDCQAGLDMIKSELASAIKCVCTCVCRQSN